MHLIVRAHASLGDLMYGVSCDPVIQLVTSRQHLGTMSGVWSHHTPSQAGDKFTETDMFPVSQQRGPCHNNRDMSGEQEICLSVSHKLPILLSSEQSANLCHCQDHREQWS